jgi:hypothetical protein
MKLFITTIWFCFIFLFSSCKKEITAKPGIVPPVSGNKAPIARIGSDQTITLPVNTVTLDGQASSDPDGNIVSYGWSQITGPNLSIIETPLNPSSVVKILIHGIYRFELKVTDNKGLSARDTIQIIVNSSTGTISCGSNRPMINATLLPFGALSEARFDVAIISAGNKIFFAGGTTSANTPSDRVDIYDIETQGWSIGTLSVARSNIAVTSVGTKVFFAGGSQQSPWDYGELYPNVDIYDVATNKWSITYLNGDGIEGLAAVSAMNKAFFAGGNYFQNFSNKVEVYDVSSNTWTSTGSGTLSEGRTNLSAFASGNKIYFAGGNNQYFRDYPSDNIDIYDLVSDSWSVSKLSEPKQDMAAIAFNNKIYWAGGITLDLNYYTNNSSLVEISDELTQTSEFACLFQPNSGFTAVLKDNAIVFFTGRGEIKNKFDIYNTGTNKWSVGVMPKNVENASIISVNNTLYVAGGIIEGVLSNKVWKLEF